MGQLLSMKGARGKRAHLERVADEDANCEMDAGRRGQRGRLAATQLVGVRSGATVRGEDAPAPPSQPAIRSAVASLALVVDPVHSAPTRSSGAAAAAPAASSGSMSAGCKLLLARAQHVVGVAGERCGSSRAEDDVVLWQPALPRSLLLFHRQLASSPAQLQCSSRCTASGRAPARARSSPRASLVLALVLLRPLRAGATRPGHRRGSTLGHRRTLQTLQG